MKKLILWVCIFIILLGGCKKEYDFVSSNKAVEYEEDQLWVEVSLKEDDHKVFIREGPTIIREMPCSGGTEDEPTITGQYTLKNRGPWFYSERFKEGGLYWVRIKDQYLFHSVPIDKEWNFIKEEAQKLGKAASHGCIRLSEDNAKWFYDNVPDGTMVYIYYDETTSEY